MHPPRRPQTRLPAVATAAAAGALAMLSGCASLNTLDADVSAYGTWPAGRAPGTYTFDRLPSQAAHAARQSRVELLATGPLEKAGFRPAPAGTSADVTVQVGARTDVTEISPWNDPLWWHGPYGGPYFYPRPPGVWSRPWWGPGPWVGPGPWWGPGPLDTSARYSRQVALLIRDRATGQPLYETHAESTGNSAGSERVVGALFSAAMAEFPKAEPEPHVVHVMLAPAVAPAASAADAAPAASAPGH